jgi:hypothetical protein
MQFILLPKHKSLSCLRIRHAIFTPLPSPNLSNTAHLKALTAELETSTELAAKAHKGRVLIRQLKSAVDIILNPPVGGEQMVIECPINNPPETNDNTIRSVGRVACILLIAAACRL